MKRMNLRDVPDEVYEALASRAEERHQSLNAFVVERLTETAQMIKAADYFDSYQPPRGTGITVEDVVEAIREGREGR